MLVQPYPRQSGVDSQNDNLIWGKDKDKDGFGWIKKYAARHVGGEKKYPID